jgi:hypothetical protein
MSTTPPPCGAQQAGTVPSQFDWWPFVAVPIAGGALVWVATHGIPIINGIVGAATPTAFGVLAASAAGAAAILTTILYFVLQPNGCIRSVTNGEPICVSGIVEDTTDENSTAIDILAPFAMVGPGGMFDLVVRSQYNYYVSHLALWVFCDDANPPAPMLPCLIKSITGCGGQVGSLVGGIVGAVAGIILGYLAAAAVAGAIGCAATLIFYLLCLLLVLIVAAIVAAAVTYGGSLVGGWAGEAITAATNGSNPVNAAWEGLSAGDIVTVNGNWVTSSTTGSNNVGANELFYVTSIARNGQMSSPAPYTTAQADANPPDDCPPTGGNIQ